MHAPDPDPDPIISFKFKTIEPGSYKHRRELSPFSSLQHHVFSSCDFLLFSATFDVSHPSIPLQFSWPPPLSLAALLPPPPPSSEPSHGLVEASVPLPLPALVPTLAYTASSFALACAHYDPSPALAASPVPSTPATPVEPTPISPN